MAVEPLQSASAAAPAPGTSTAAPSQAAPSSPAVTGDPFMDALAELGAEPSPAPAKTEKTVKPKNPPAPAPEAGADPDIEGAFAEGDPEPNPDDDTDAAADAGDPDASNPNAGATDDDGTGEEEADPNAEPALEDPAEDTPHEDLPPEHFKKLPAWAQKRLGKQAETVKSLREELATAAFGIVPTPASPLAHVDSLDTLQQQTALAKQVRTWCRANPDGGMVGDREFTADDVTAKLAHAEAVLDAAPDWQLRLTQREAVKPWEGARKVCPEMFQAGTEEHDFAATAVRMCPEIKLKLANWEMLLAAAVRSIKQVAEETAGKAKYVRMEMKDGKVVAPVRAAAPAASGKPATTVPKVRPPATPGGAPPPLRTTRGPGAKPDTAALEARYAQTRNPDDFRDLVAALAV